MVPFSALILTVARPPLNNMLEAAAWVAISVMVMAVTGRRIIRQGREREARFAYVKRVLFGFARRSAMILAKLLESVAAVTIVSVALVAVFR